MSGNQDITPAARPIYDDKIDSKMDEKDAEVTPAVLGFDGHIDASEQAQMKRWVIRARNTTDGSDLDMTNNEFALMESKLADMSLERTVHVSTPSLIGTDGPDHSPDSRSPQV